MEIYISVSLFHLFAPEPDDSLANHRRNKVKEAEAIEAMMRSGTSINDITAPISRTRRRKSSSLPRGPIVIAAACFVLILIGFAAFAISSSGQGDNIVQPDDRQDAIAPIPQSNNSLRRASTEAVEADAKKESYDGLLIHTNLGIIRIYFTPSLSGQTSINYIQKVVQGSKKNGEDEQASCDRGNFYRAEPDLLIQGVLSQNSVKSKVTLGPCPEVDWKPTTPCPAHDPNCGCHGPIMTRGMVGWAGGGAGPDFFINTRHDPVDWWEHQHTVWGQVRDEESLQLIDRIYKLPATTKGMRLLVDKIQFRIELF